MPKEINYTEVLISPLADFITEVGKGVAQAQQELDQHSLAAQKSIDTATANKELAQIGYRATWYQMPEIQFEMKMSIYYEEHEDSTTTKKGLFFAPFNAKYQNSFSYKSEGTSSIKVRIVPVPQPLATEKNINP